MFKHGDRETVVASTSATTTTMPSSTSASESESPSQSASASASESPSPSQPSESPSQSPNEEQTPEQKVNLDASISVINGTATNGYAAQEAQRLQGAGFTNVAPSNPNGMQLPSQSVVWYQNDADLATAQKVAETLGVSTVQKAEGIAVPVAVVLMN